MAEWSSLIHWVSVDCSSAVGGELRTRETVVPSKNSQKPLALMASWKCMAKAVQFKPVGMSFGTEEGRRSVVVSAVVNMGMKVGREQGPISCKNID